MMDAHSVLDTEVNGSIIMVDSTTKDLTESSTRDDDDDDFQSSVVSSAFESAEASFPTPEELRSSRTSRSSRGIWTGASSPKSDAASSSSLTTMNNKKRLCRLYTLLIAVVVLIFFVIIPAVVVSKNNSKEVAEAETSSQDRPRPTYEEVVAYIVARGISTESDVLTPETPQNKAALWLARDDPANIPLPPALDITSYDGYRYMTRYIIAVHYFAFNADNWEIDLNWLTESDICDWNRQVYINGRPGKIGLFCFNFGTGEKDEDGNVVIQRVPSSLQVGTYFKFACFCCYVPFSSANHLINPRTFCL